MLHTRSISYTYFSFKGAFTHIYYVIDYIAVVMGVMVALALVLYQRCVCMCVSVGGAGMFLYHMCITVYFYFPHFRLSLLKGKWLFVKFLLSLCF